MTDEEKNIYFTEQLDIFPIGVMFYEMLAGEKPFYSNNYDNDAEIMRLPGEFDIVPLS
jgi:serine/threonine protein kinase